MNREAQLFIKKRNEKFMNKKLKFRAWDTVMKQFINVNFCISGAGDIYELQQDKETLWLSAIGRNDRYVVQQYTGLKDKTEKEIYEGDIIKSWYSRDMSGRDIVEVIYPVEFEVHSETAEFDIPFIHNAEVIGNIYEHPQLLNK